MHFTDHIQFNSIPAWTTVQNAKAPKGLISSVYFFSLCFLYFSIIFLIEYFTPVPFVSSFSGGSREGAVSRRQENEIICVLTRQGEARA